MVWNCNDHRNDNTILYEDVNSLLEIHSQCFPLALLDSGLAPQCSSSVYRLNEQKFKRLRVHCHSIERKDTAWIWASCMNNEWGALSVCTFASSAGSHRSWSTSVLKGRAGVGGTGQHCCRVTCHTTDARFSSTQSACRQNDPITSIVLIFSDGGRAGGQSETCKTLSNNLTGLFCGDERFLWSGLIPATHQASFMTFAKLYFVITFCSFWTCLFKRGLWVQLY